MDFSPAFILNSILLGVGLAMDAFSVSVANGILDKNMKRRNELKMAGCFALFQFGMPMIGWICVHTVVQYFNSFQKFIPWIALLLLLYIGGNMLIGAIKEQKKEEPTDREPITGFALIMAGVATSIDALSVGFTISEYGLFMAFVCALIIMVVTFILCIAGIKIGKRFGDIFGSKAEIIGGLILIGIGIEIFIKGVF